MTDERPEIMEDLNHIFLSIKFEFLRHIRRKRFYIMLAISLIFSLLYYLIGKAANFDFADDPNEHAFISLSLVTLFIIISASVFAGDAVNGEFTKKTGLLLFTTPQRRESIFIGKYLAALFAIYIFISLTYLIIAIQILELYGSDGLTTKFAQSYLLALLYSAAVTSLIFFFSTILKTTTASSIIGFFTLFLIMPITTGVVILLKRKPWFILTNTGYIVTWILLPQDEWDDIDFAPGLNKSIMVMFAYCMGFLLSSIFIASRKPVE